jgi:hypothetical protein
VTDVVNDGYRQPPGDSERRAATSDELVSEEALRTERDSSIAVKFIDGSELNVESQSEVVLSDYLFDPAAAAATGVISLNTGLFHFNSNSVQDDGLVLRTPVATIGIRGTQFLVTVADDATIVDILEGKVEVKPLDGGKPILCEGGQSILVESAQSDAICGDLGSFSTAAAPPTEQEANAHGNIADRDGEPEAESKTSGGGSKPGGGSPGGGDPGGGDPGGGDPGGGDPGGGNPGGPDGKNNHSGLGDGTNPGKGHGNGNGNGNGGGKNNGGTNNPGGGNH